MSERDAFLPDDPATLRGQLQRGLGTGVRAALVAGTGAHDLVLGCIAVDPRRDRQLDARADGYAQLAIACGVSADEIAATLDPGADRSPLSIEVLARMAVRGAPGAGDVLDTLAASVRWADEVAEWAQAGAPATSPFGAAMARSADARARAEEQRMRELATRSTDELLARTDPREAWRIGRVLMARGRAADVPALRRTAADPGHPMFGAALRTLAARDDRTALPVIEQLLPSSPRPGLAGHLSWAFAAYPFEATRNTATRWLTGDEPFSRRCAANAFAHDGAPGDAPLLTRELSRALDDGASADAYLITNLAEALGRLADAGPFPVLRRAFSEPWYSYGRVFVAEALTASDPAFGVDLAPDALWDCEPGVRTIAAQHAPPADPVVAARLAELAADPHEAGDVRRAAAEALGAAEH